MIKQGWLQHRYDNKTVLLSMMVATINCDKRKNVSAQNAESAQTIPIGFVWRNAYCSKDQGIALR